MIKSSAHYKKYQKFDLIFLILISLIYILKLKSSKKGRNVDLLSIHFLK
jgi:hypothetical protein